MQNKNESGRKEKPDNSQRAKLYKELEAEFAKEVPDVWNVLNIRKKLGLWEGKIETVKTKSYSLTKGPHYYIIEDIKKRTVRCISCPVSHGGILEAHLLFRYKVENGVIYLDGKATNEVPENFNPDR